MSDRNIKYYFGRLNLIAVFNDKKEFLLRALKTKKFLQHRDFNWGFFDIIEINSDLGDFLHGYLVKYKPEFSEEVANPETHSLEDQEIDNFVVAKTRFFLHIKSGIISYHPIGNIISRETFVERFCKLFEHSLENMFINAEIQSIEEDYKIFDVIRAFSKIKRVQIYLHPPNPSNREIWKRTDERLKKLGAANYYEHYEVDPEIGNLNITEDSEINSKISMADDGYGKADVTGELNGEVKTISTSDNPITTQAPNDDVEASNVLDKLLIKLRIIFSRFNDEN